MTSRDVVVVRGGRVVCPASDVDREADLVLTGERVSALERPGATVPTGARVVDASGCLVLPGAIDLATHLREPGREEEETLEGTLEAAARGGFTTLLALPDTSPPVDGADDVKERLARAERIGGPSLLVAGCLTKGRAGKELAEIGEMAAAGAVAFTDAPSPVADAELLRRAMEYARGFHRPVFAVGACPSLSGPGVVAEGAIATRLGLAGIPEAAEVSFVARHIELARLTGARVHLGPLSSARSVDLLERARGEGLPVTAEVHPWHLVLDENALLERPYDTALRLEPPLRTPADREALVGAVRRGALLVASGHAPVGPVQREVEFAAAEPGAVSLPTCLPLLLDGEEGRGVLTPWELARAVSWGPAELLGLEDRGRLSEGARGDVVVLDPRERPIADRQLLGTQVLSSPILGATLHARVRATLVEARVAHEARAEQ